MHRNFIAALAAAAAMAAAGCRPAGTTAGGDDPVAWPDTSGGIHYFQTFDPGAAGAGALAAHAVYVWGASAGSIAAYRASSNPGIVLSKYMPYTRDWEPRPLSYWTASHPDWVLYQCDRTTPAYEFGDVNVPLDISNPAVLEAQVQGVAVPASAAGFDAIAADNYDLDNEFGACGVYQGGAWKQLYTGARKDPQYTRDVLAWTRALRARLRALPRPLALVPNFQIGGAAIDDAGVQAVVDAVDGILDECSFTGCGGGASVATWLNVQAFAEAVQARGKAYFHINEVAVLDQAALQFSLASYLLSKERAAALFVSTVQGYGVDRWSSEYAAPVGTACEAMRAEQGAYVRRFSGGLAVANPGGAAVTFTLPAGSWTDVHGAAVESPVALGPVSGLVLLRGGAPGC